MRIARCFYVVRCDFPHPELLEDWDRWYVGHIELLLTVPGFLGGQRFTTAASPDGRPFLAIYELSSPAVMRSDEYERARGFGGWEAQVTRWTRDLVEDEGGALEFATPPGGSLWAAFYRGEAPPGAAEAVGLDRSFRAAAWQSLAPGEPPPVTEVEGAAAAVFEPRTSYIGRMDTPAAAD